MAISTDWATLTFSVPQGDLTLISGTLYEMDTEVDFRQAINAIMASEEGIVFDDPIIHNTEVTVAGTTFARTIEVINGYSVTFTPDSQWTARFIGSNNNIFDVENDILNQNQVQIISNNSGGLISGGFSEANETTLDAILTAVNALPTALEIADAVWNAQVTDYLTNGTIGKELADAMAQVADVYTIQGLDSANPMTVTTTGRDAGDIDLNFTGDGVTTTTVTRQ